MKKKSRKNKWTNLIAVIQMILSAVLFGMIAYFQILPLWALTVLGVVLLLLCVLSYYAICGKKSSRLNRKLGIIMSVIVSACLLVGNVAVYNALDTFNAITGANYKVDAISVIALDDSPVDKIEDLSGAAFGTVSTMDIENTKYAIEEINKVLGNEINTLPFTGLNELVDALFARETDVIIINEAFRNLILDYYPSFSEDTKVIYQVNKKTEIEPQVQKDFNVTQDSFNVYLSGIDTYGPVSTTSRSDVNMIISINPKTKQVLLTNIPRDYYVPLACQNGAMDKLTHAGVYGVECSLNTLENFLGIDISFYGRVNFSSLVNIVDALGGIEVYSEYTFTAINGQTFSAGMNKMNGESALTFSRERKALPGGDRDRGKNQQAVIQGIVNKALSPAIVANYTSVMNAVSGSFQTNMASTDISKLIKMQLSDMAQWTITTANLDGTGTNAITYSYGQQPLYVMVPNMDTVVSAQEKINAILASPEEQ